MGNNQAFKFVDLSITSPKLPIHTHLFLELDNGHFLLVDSTSQTDLLISDDKCANWDSVETGDFTAGKITRARNIVSVWHDRTNSKAYFMDWTAGGEITMWYLDLSDYSVNAMGADIGTIAYIGYDVCIRDGNIEAFTHETDTDNIEVFRWTGVVWGIIAGIANVGTVEASFAVVAGTTTYFYTVNAGVAEIVKFNGAVITREDNINGYALPTSRNQHSIAYDGDNLLYMIIKKVADGKNYLYIYNITGDSLTEYSEYDIALMLDRNCVSSAPNEMEKAFDIAKDASNNSRIWEIKPKKGGLIQLQTINKNANIIAMTDNFLMFAGGLMYENTDIMATQTIAEGIINKGIFPIVERGRFNCHPDDAHFFYNDDSLKVYDDTDELILFAKITDKSQDENGIYQFGLDAYTNELWRRTYTKSHSANKSSDKVKDNIDNACGFCHRASSIDSSDATNYSYKQDRPPMAMLSLDRFMERKVGYAQPNGKVWTKAHDGLAKAPQYYPATYNFRDDDVGDEPSGWTIDNGAGCTTTVMASLDGHKKVLQCYDGNAATRVDIRRTFTQGLNIIIEFWCTKSSVAANTDVNVYLFEDATNCVQLRFQDDDLDYNDGVYMSLKDNFLIANTLFRFKIVLNDTANTFDLYIDGVLEGNNLGYRNNTVSGVNKIVILTDAADTGYYGYFDAIGISTDANYDVGDNLVAWDVEINGNLDLINIDREKPSYYVKKLGITRATCVGAAGISQTYNDATLEDGKAIIPLKEYRDLKIQATTEALQVATALFNIFSTETKFIGLRVVNQEFVQPGKTVNFANTGDITVAEADLMVLFYTYDFVGDVYELMILTDNVGLLREFESYLDRSELLVHQNSTAVRENATNIAASGDCHIKIDTYTGNGNNNREIPVGFTPKSIVIILHEAVGEDDPFYKDDQMPEWHSTTLNMAVEEDNSIKFVTDGFEVNNNHGSDYHNRNGKVYTYTALG